MSSLPKTVTGQRRGCDLNPGPSAPEFSTLPLRSATEPPSVKQQMTNATVEKKRETLTPRRDNNADRSRQFSVDAARSGGGGGGG